MTYAVTARSDDPTDLRSGRASLVDAASPGLSSQGRPPIPRCGGKTTSPSVRGPFVGGQFPSSRSALPPRRILNFRFPSASPATDRTCPGSCAADPSTGEVWGHAPFVGLPFRQSRLDAVSLPRCLSTRRGPNRLSHQEDRLVSAGSVRHRLAELVVGLRFPANDLTDRVFSA